MDTSSEELAEVENTPPVQYVGLPKTLQALSEKQLQEYLINLLRDYKKKDMPDDASES